MTENSATAPFKERDVEVSLDVSNLEMAQKKPQHHTSITVSSEQEKEFSEGIEASVYLSLQLEHITTIKERK